MFKLHVSRSQRLISIKGLRLEQISRCSKCRESWKAKLCKTISHSRCYIFVNRRRICNCVFVYLSLYSCVCHWIIWNSHWNCGILERRFGGLVKALVTVSPFAAEIVCRYCFSSSLFLIITFSICFVMTISVVVFVRMYLYPIGRYCFSFSPISHNR